MDGNQSGLDIPADDDGHLILLEFALSHYVAPAVVLIGTIANLTVLVILRQTVFQRNMVSYNMAYIAITNLLYLLFIGIDWLVQVTTTRQLQNWSNESCRLWMFLYNIVSNARIWFTVVILIKFYWVATRPWPKCSLCSPKGLSVCIVGGLVTVSVHAMWLYMYEDQSGCFLAFWKHEVYPEVWQWVCTSVFSILPLSLLAVFILLTLLRIYQHGALQNRCRLNAYDLTSTILEQAVFEFLFVLFTTVTDIVTVTYPVSWLQNGNWDATLQILHLICNVINLIQTTTLFMLCLIFSSTFRQEFLQICKRKTNSMTSENVELRSDTDNSLH